MSKIPHLLRRISFSTTLTDGTKGREEYLGHDDRPAVIEHLKDILQPHLASVASPIEGSVDQRKQIDENQDSTAETAIPPCVLLLNGFPGVGKYTLARQLETIIPGVTILVDNHMLINPAEVMYPGTTPEHYQLCKAIRESALDSIKDLESTSTTVLMTSCLSSSPADIESSLNIWTLRDAGRSHSSS